MKIALDVDDVLAAFTMHAHNYFGIKMPSKIDYWCVATMDRQFGEKWFSDKIAHNDDFWRSLPILSGPQEIDFPVHCYMTSFPEQKRHLREQWLMSAGFPKAPLIITNEKKRMCEEMEIDVLVDDKPQTIVDLQDTLTKGVHFVNVYAGFKPVGVHITKLNQLRKVI